MAEIQKDGISLIDHVSFKAFNEGVRLKDCIHLQRERATRPEGSSGTQKQHYSPARIKARNGKTEILWIFFGIHTANAVCMIEKDMIGGWKTTRCK